MKPGSLRQLSSDDVARLATLSAVAKALNSSLDVRRGLRSVLSSLMAALLADRGMIHLTDSDGDVLLEVAIDKTCQPHGESFPYTATLLNECLVKKKPFVVLDAAGFATSESAVIKHIRSVMLNPITRENDEVVGIIYLDSLVKAGQFQSNDLELLGIIADMISSFLERSRGAEALSRKSAQLEEAIREIKETNRLLLESAHETIYKLSMAAEFRDDECGEHVKRVSHYSEAIAIKMGLTPDKAIHFRTASQLHDVGKVGIPDSVLLKPGRYTEYEREIMKQHTVIGAQILSGSRNLVIRLAEEIALTHHEKWNGTGYPRGLAGSAIPLSGRIVAIADVFDALTTERRYKKAWTLERAFALVKEEAGQHFDPEVAAFLALEGQIREIRDRFQPPAEAEVVVPPPQVVQLTRSEARDRLTLVQRQIEALAQGSVPSQRDEIAQALNDLGFFLASQGQSNDATRRLTAHWARNDLNPQQAPRLAELLADIECRISGEAAPATGGWGLVIDPDPQVCEALAIEATQRGLELMEVGDFEEAERALAVRRPNWVLVEVLIPGSDAFVERLMQRDPLLPLVVLSSEGSFTRRLELARLGGSLYLQKPLPAAAVFDEIQERLGGQGERRERVLVIDDDPVVAKTLHHGLEKQGFDVQILSDPLQVWSYIISESPDVLLLDWEMPRASGLDICKVLRNDPRTSHLPILVVTGHIDNETYSEALRAGADDVLTKPVDAARLAVRIRGRLGRDFVLRKSGARDPFTGLPDLRSALKTASHLFSLAVRQGATFSLCAVQVEGYLELQQRWGSGRFKEVLRKLAQLLEQRSRSEDLLVHYKPDCFLLGLYGATPEANAQGAASINARLEKEDFGLPPGESPPRCSFHFASYPVDGTDLTSLLEKVDQLTGHKVLS